MRNILLFIVAALLLVAMPAEAKKTKGAKIEFATKVHDFGFVQESKGNVSYGFEFKNVGNAPLIIVNASASCGCTKPEYPRNPIKPGQTGVIKVTFRTKHQSGPFEKSVTVKTNNQIERIRIKGNVIPAAIK